MLKARYAEPNLRRFRAGRPPTHPPALSGSGNSAYALPRATVANTKHGGNNGGGIRVDAGTQPIVRRLRETNTVTQRRLSDSAKLPVSESGSNDAEQKVLGLRSDDPSARRHLVILPRLPTLRYDTQWHSSNKPQSQRSPGIRVRTVLSIGKSTR